MLGLSLCPTGKSLDLRRRGRGIAGQDTGAKIFIFRFFGSRDLLAPIPLRRRGVRVVTNVERNAVDVIALTDERR
jgi:hypothetical protein